MQYSVFKSDQRLSLDTDLEKIEVLLVEDIVVPFLG